MPMPKIKLPNIGTPHIYQRKSPLMPPKEGYPIKLGQGISMTDLEMEPVKVTQGGKMSYMPAYSPYLMKGATQEIRGSNANLEAENERIAVDLATQWRSNKPFKAPVEPYKPLLKKNARDSTVDEQADALVKGLEERSKNESELAFKTFMGNEREGSDPTRSPTWILKTTGQTKNDSLG